MRRRPASLAHEVRRFRSWSDALDVPPGERHGEWECDYDDWPELTRAFVEHLDRHDPGCVDGPAVADLVYAVARENETGLLVDELVGRPSWFRALLPHVLVCDEPDARWQVAQALGWRVLPRDETEEALLTLVDDQDEYVSRMALGALGAIGSAHAEARCERAWETGHEYQRIMALSVLAEVRSARLGDYLDRARQDGRAHVVAAAERIGSA